RLVLDPDVSVQAPPNLTAPEDLALLIAAGVNDWGGISPLTPGYVNPEAPWPHGAALAAAGRAPGDGPPERLPLHPPHVARPGFLAPELADRVRALGAATRKVGNEAEAHPL